MGQVILRRIMVLIPTIIGITVATFAITKFIPGEPLSAILGQRALSNPEIVANYKAKWGLDKSLPEQYVIYIRNMLQGDLGKSIRTQRPVTQDLSEFFPATAELALAALFISIVGGVVLGSLAAVFHDGWIDQTVRVIALVGSSMPVFWMALIFLQIFYANLSWFPGPGRLDTALTPPPTITGMYVLDGLLAGNWEVAANAFSHLILPAIVLGWYQLGLIARVMRASVLETIFSDYVRTARAKGLRESWIFVRHIAPNAMLPTITIIGLAVAGLMAGAVQTETIFSWPGIGRYALDSSKTLDFPGIMGATLLISFIFISSNLVVDLLYNVLDPRIRERAE